jgi:hypothetical protein
MVSTSVGQLSALGRSEPPVTVLVRMEPELGLIFWTGIKFLLFQELDLELGSGSIYV